MMGALLLAGRACLRSGPGLVQLAAPAAEQRLLPLGVAEATSIPLAEEDGAIAHEAVVEALRAAERAQAVALGPGLSRRPGAAAFARDFALRCPKPLVLDADGLNAFEGRLESLADREAPTVLTPHPGEAARLLGLPSGRAVQEDREGAAATLARAAGAIAVLKGAGTIVRSERRLWINDTGNPGMAKGGSGDVLTGVLAGLLAQGLDPYDAARLAVWVHGCAGDLAARDLTETGLCAGDLIERLPDAWRFVEEAC